MIFKSALFAAVAVALVAILTGKDTVRMRQLTLNQLRYNVKFFNDYSVEVNREDGLRFTMDDRSGNPTRKKKPRLDRRRYAYRYRVEVFFHDLKRFRAVATRFEKTSRNYLAILHLACSMVWLHDLLGGL